MDLANKPELLQQPVQTPSRQDAKTTRPYDSNPFTLSFNALGRLFDFNATWAIVLLIFSFIGGGLQFIGNILRIPANEETSKPYYTASATPQASSLTQEQILGIIVATLIVVVLVGIVLLVSFAIQTFISGMFTYVALQSEKGKKVTFGEAFGAVQKRFWRLLLAQGLASIKIFLWTLLLIIPGIIAALRYALLPYVIMDEPETNKGAKTAHTRVKSLVKGRLVEVLGLLIATNLIPIIGRLLQLAGGAAQYRQLSASVDGTRPKVHWLNYLVPVVCIALVFLFIVLIGILVAIVASSGQ